MKLTNIVTQPSTKGTSLTSKEDQQLREACQDFEAVFLSYLMKGMRSTVQKSDLFGSSREEEMFQEMIDQEVCKNTARSQGIGLAEMLYKQLSKDSSSNR